METKKNALAKLPKKETWECKKKKRTAGKKGVGCVQKGNQGGNPDHLTWQKKLFGINNQSQTKKGV